MQYPASDAVRVHLARELDNKTQWILAATEIELLADEVRFHGQDRAELGLLAMTLVLDQLALRKLKAIGAPTKIDFYCHGDRFPFPSEVLTLTETQDDSDPTS